MAVSSNILATVQRYSPQCHVIQVVAKRFATNKYNTNLKLNVKHYYNCRITYSVVDGVIIYMAHNMI